MDQPIENATIPGYALSVRARQRLYRLFAVALGIFIIGFMLGIVLTGVPSPLP